MSRFRFRLRLSSALSLVAMAALTFGWLLDRSRLAQDLAKAELQHERTVDRLHLGLSVRQEALTLAGIVREHRRTNQDQFKRYLQGSVVGMVIQLFAVRDRIDELELDDSDAKDLVRELMDLLDCETANDFITLANQIGFKENDFLLTYNSTPEELAKFYRFIAVEKKSSVGARLSNKSNDPQDR